MTQIPCQLFINANFIAVVQDLFFNTTGFSGVKFWVSVKKLVTFFIVTSTK